MTQRTNPFQPLYDKCNVGDPAQKHREIPDFPTHIDIEPVSVCNMRCRMCPTGIHALDRPTGMMDMQLFKKIVDQCPVGMGLRFIGWGEPLMHPELNPMLKYAQHLYTHINTNGLLMDKKMAISMIMGSLGSIKFSFQGIDPVSYEAMRGEDSFAQVVKAIQIMSEWRGELGVRPYIAASTSVTHESEEEIEAFKEQIRPFVDEITVGRTTFDFIDLAKAPPKYRELAEAAAKDSTVVKTHPDPCPEVYDKLSIHHNGDVVVCCNAYSTEGVAGNVNDTPLKEIWTGTVMEEYRKRLDRKEYTGPLCSVCYDYKSLTKGA